MRNAIGTKVFSHFHSGLAAGRQDLVRSRIARSFALLLLSSGLLLSACATTPAPTGFDLKKFADNLETNLKGNSVGYAFTVGYQDQWADLRGGGYARTVDDPPATPMSAFTQFSIASVTKNITAAAVLQALDAKHIGLDTQIGSYFPSNWTPSSQFAGLTFRQLLTHTSGIVTPTYVDYASLKNLVENPVLCPAGSSYPLTTPPPPPCDLVSAVDVAASGNGVYSNSNFALFRILLPGITHIPVPADPPGSVLGTGYGLAYQTYVVNYIFAPTHSGLSNLTCASDGNTGLSYHLPVQPGQHGMDLGDLTAYCGSQGWVMSTQQLNAFVRALNFTSSVPYSNWLGVSAANNGGANNPGLAQMMQQTCAGYAQQVCKGTIGSSYTFWQHGGYYPDAVNPGAFNSHIFVFSNGVSVALFVNSVLNYPPQPVPPAVPDLPGRVYQASSTPSPAQPTSAFRGAWLCHAPPPRHFLAISRP